jgi:hypothetical protein
VAWVKAFAPKFQRFPDRPRFYSNIDVPSLPAVRELDAAAPAPAAPRTAPGTPS